MKVTSTEDAAKLFPSIQNLDFVVPVFIFLEKYGLQCTKIEFYISFVGLFLTILHVIILTRKNMMMSSIISVMIAIAVCDGVSMAIAISVNNMIASFYDVECTPPLTLFKRYVFTLLSNIREDVIRCSTWLGLLMALFRFVVLRFSSRPMFTKFSSISFGFYAFLYCFLLSSSLSLVNYFRTTLVETGTWTPGKECDLMPSDTVWTTYETQSIEFFAANNRFMVRVFSVTNGVLSKIIPSFLLPILTLLLIMEIRITRKKITASTANVMKRTERTTTLVILMTTSFFIASLPAGISTLAQIMYPDVGLIFISSLVKHFCNLILTINASINCFICFAMSSDYRRTTLEVLKIKKKSQIHSASVF